MPFADPLPALAVASDTTWRLVGPLVYRGATETFTVPDGFLTDLASVPRPVQWLVPVSGRYTWAAVLHDWLCSQLSSCRLLGIDPRAAQAGPRDADGIFRRVMREYGVPPARRWLMWAGVRLGSLVDPSRRAGWWRDAPAVAALALAAAPLVLPLSVAVAAAQLVDAAVERLGR